MAKAKAIVVIPKMDKSKTGVIMDIHPLVQCKDCKHWDISTRESGNDIFVGPWESAVCERLRDMDRWGDIPEEVLRTDSNWFCGDGEGKIENDWI